MSLMTVEKDAQEIATSISELMGVDVVIVDDKLQRIADTFHYPYKNIEIRKNSIIGQIVKTGRPLVVDNKDFFRSCMDCKDRTWCKMQGLMGVPILFQEEVIGAIGLVVRERNVLQLVKNTNLIVSFLQQAAEMLSNKLAKAENLHRFQEISLRWEHMLNAVDAGVALLDKKNDIITHNEIFCRLFDIEEDCRNQPFTKYVSHSLINEVLEKHLDVDGQTVMILLKESVFCGQVHVKQIYHDKIHYGAAISFQNLYNTFPVDSFYYGTQNKKLSLQQMYNDSKLTDTLIRAAHSGMEPVLLWGNSVPERHLRQIAAAIHEESGRKGYFNYVSSEDWLEGTPLMFDPADDGNIPQAILFSHQGTLCIGGVFDLPVIQQRSLLHYLRGSLENRTYSNGLKLFTRLIFLVSGPIPDPDSRYICRELLEELEQHLIQIPNPFNSQKQLSVLLKQLFKEYSCVYDVAHLHIEAEAWNMLLSFPWEQGYFQVNRVVEQLVSCCEGTIRVGLVRQLLEVQDVSVQSVEEFERDKINRMLNEGVSIEQIANILKISRSTLYRRIKKYNLNNKE